MFKRSICLLLSLSILCSCAYVSTKSDYDGIERQPAVNQYEKCLVRLGFYGRYKSNLGIITSREAGRHLGDLKKYLESSTQFKIVCRELVYEDFEIEVSKDDLGEQAFRKAIEVRSSKSEMPVFAFYLPQQPLHSPFMYWGIVYVLSFGFVPLGFPVEERYWFVRHEPNQLYAKAVQIENKKWDWYWTPLLLYPYSKKDITSEEAKYQIRRESLTKALNGN